MGRSRTKPLGSGKGLVKQSFPAGQPSPGDPGEEKRTPAPSLGPPSPRFKPGEDGRAVALDPEMNMENVLALTQAFGTEELDLIWHFMEQLAGTVPHGSSMATKLNRCVPILHGLKPRDELEAMLFVQMVGVHNAAMECLNRALHPQQAVEGVEANIGRVAALTKVFMGQLEALQKYRGKGSEQRVTVEHVHVHQGGQAIVGAVAPRREGEGGES